MSFVTRLFNPLRNRCSKGYTLIEVLIASAIFGAMVTLASMALYQGLRQYQGLMDRGLNFWDYARYLWMDRSFNSAVDYYVFTRLDGWTPYFIGNQEFVSYVSLAPLAGDVPVVVWLRSEKGDDGKGSLVYYELPVYTKDRAAIERDYLFADYKKGNSVKVLQGIENVEISFYGYDLNRGKNLWFLDYDARRRKFLPMLVKISYVYAGHKSALIFGVNVNSTLKMNYNEIYRNL